MQADSEESAHKTTKQIYEITSLLVEFFRRIVVGGNAKEQWYYKITNSQNYGDCNHPSQIIVLTLKKKKKKKFDTSTFSSQSSVEKFCS